MPRYIVKDDFPIRGQQGDDFDVVFHVPAIFPLSLGDLIVFTIFQETGNKVVLTKEVTNITPGQVITLNFTDEETAPLLGKYRWLLRIDRNGVKTRIGKGIFQFL